MIDVLLLKVLFHEIFVLERLVVKTLRKVSPEGVLELIQLGTFLVVEVLQLDLELFLHCGQLSLPKNLAFLEVLVVHLSAKIGVPVESEGRKLLNGKLILLLINLGKVLKMGYLCVNDLTALLDIVNLGVEFVHFILSFVNYLFVRIAHFEFEIAFRAGGK